MNRDRLYREPDATSILFGCLAIFALISICAAVIERGNTPRRSRLAPSHSDGEEVRYARAAVIAAAEQGTARSLETGHVGTDTAPAGNNAGAVPHAARETER